MELLFARGKIDVLVSHGKDHRLGESSKAENLLKEKIKDGGGGGKPQKFEFFKFKRVQLKQI